MMRCILHPEALREVSAADDYYTQISPELGNAFLKQFRDSVGIIVENPETWRVIEENVHVFWLRRFPFAIYYTMEEKSITIFAVMHTSRKPGYWKDRT